MEGSSVQAPVVAMRSQAGVNSKGSLLYFSKEISAGTLAIEMQRNLWEGLSAGIPGVLTCWSG